MFRSSVQPLRLVLGLALLTLLATGCGHDLALDQQGTPAEAQAVVTASPAPTSDDADPTGATAASPGDPGPAPAAASPNDAADATPATAADTPSEGRSAPPAGAATIDVALDDYTITPASDAIAPGTVTFDTTNVGQAPHEMLVVRAASADDLPLDEDGAVDEDALGDAIVDETAFLQSGDGQALTVDLPAGEYVLVCNLVKEDVEIESHFAFGMHTEITVVAD